MTVTTDDAIKAIFDIYCLYERASGAKLNPTKSKGLWLRAWAHRSDPPFPLDWSSECIPCLGTFLGPNLAPSVNWDPRIASLSNVLDLWQRRCLSFQGKYLVANALALSELWYIATVLPLPEPLETTINQSLFKFFWSGKKELVARTTNYLDKSNGGFKVVNVRLKTLALHAQWVKRFIFSPNKWCCFFSFYVHRCFGTTVQEVLSFPAFYPPHLLPPFFASLLESWALLGGHSRGGAYFLRPTDDGKERPLSASTTKLCYKVLLDSVTTPPHCIHKFSGTFGPLYWDDTWKQVHVMPLDRHVIDVNWKIAHGVIYTADRLVSFGMAVDPMCHCNNHHETLQHLFFDCLFSQAILQEIEAIFRRVTPLCPSLESRHLLFGFNGGEREREIVPPVFSYTLNLVKFFIWLSRNNFRFRNERPSIPNVLSSVRRRLFFYLPLFAKRFQSPRRKRYFRRSWNVIGKFWPNV